MFKFDVSLRIKHPSIDPSVITQTLGLQPHTAWMAGTRRGTKDGKELEGNHDKTYWSHKLVRSRDESLEETVERTLKELESLEGFSLQITESGGNIELFIGLYLEDSAGVFLSWRVLDTASRLRTDLAFDLYSKRQEP